MKKISLKNLDALGIQKLSRESLKNVAGGNLCGPGEFMCGDGSCIPASKVMDGVQDCMDGSDEIDNGTYPSVRRGECIGIGSVGKWNYNPPVYYETCMQDIQENCSSKQGACYTTYES